MSENGIKAPKKDRKLLLPLLGAGLGVALLIFGGLRAGDREETEEKEPTAYLSDPDPRAYARSVEEQIKELCSRVRGAGTVSVAVTLRGGYRAVYAADSKSSAGGYQSNTVLTGNGSSEEAVLICYENPEISGIGIVCAGGSDPAVRADLVALVSAALGVGANKIYVAAGG